ncbi:LLM class F420-dependent oxidoreductase [Naasia lichenicola]|uniref:LLM class F420-dependent oxidoreductase n=1 Tax=Naasia lichenicola TaxID=2565933 RepID=A0A4V3WSZ7_9MICO|nr:LLM class F420-dependent oxidoreductase [Naasia lichenicola]THG30067.1 LLM class F420-dependent oxidoreductase [Naasia lichenicola]
MAASTPSVPSSWTARLGTVGVWRSTSSITPELAQTIEQLGYGTLWLGGSPESALHEAEEFLDATEHLQIATGIVNIWQSDAAELAASYHRIEARHPGRLLLGIGTGHRESTPERVRPIDAMVSYLDVLDRENVPVESRAISALGPRMLELARERSAGTHPYLTVPTQTREARDALGAAALVAPEQTVVLDENSDSARVSARRFLKSYLQLDNYTRNMRRAGFTDDDIANGGSDQLVDGLVAHGSAAEISAVVQSHLDQGADHVCIQVQPANSDITTPLELIAAELSLTAQR